MQFETGRTSRLGNREINQDRIIVIESDAGSLLVLGDGLGGKPRGELAAQTLVDSVSESMSLLTLPVEHPKKFLHELVRRAHHDILMVGQEQSPPITPGSTAVICLIQNGVAIWAHVGDSRCYLFRSGIPLYRTQDHSYVEQLYQKGKISLKKTYDHPMRNYVTQCIGLNTVEPDIEISNEIELEVGDVLLLCSDGFWEPLDDAQIGMGILEGNLNQTLNKLGERAESIKYPHSDNTSAIATRIISLQQPKKDQDVTASPRKQKKNKLNSAISDIEEALKDYGDEMEK